MFNGKNLPKYCHNTANLLNIFITFAGFSTNTINK